MKQLYASCIAIATQCCCVYTKNNSWHQSSCVVVVRFMCISMHTTAVLIPFYYLAFSLLSPKLFVCMYFYLCN